MCSLSISQNSVLTIVFSRVLCVGLKVGRISPGSWINCPREVFHLCERAHSSLTLWRKLSATQVMTTSFEKVVVSERGSEVNMWVMSRSAFDDAPNFVGGVPGAGTAYPHSRMNLLIALLKRGSSEK